MCHKNLYAAHSAIRGKGELKIDHNESHLQWKMRIRQNILDETKIKKLVCISIKL